MEDSPMLLGLAGRYGPTRFWVLIESPLDRPATLFKARFRACNGDRLRLLDVTRCYDIEFEISDNEVRIGGIDP